MKRPASTEIASYYQRYVEYVPEGNIVTLMDTVHQNTQALIQSIPEHRGNYRYAPSKWTIKEVLLHIIDTERVFAYRALRFARKDQTPLPGFNQDDYVPHSNASSRTLADIAAEFQAVRQATIEQFKHYSKAVAQRTGVGNDNPFSVQGLAYSIVGHELHHCTILRKLYLNI